MLPGHWIHDLFSFEMLEASLSSNYTSRCSHRTTFILFSVVLFFIGFRRPPWQRRRHCHTFIYKQWCDANSSMTTIFKIPIKAMLFPLVPICFALPVSERTDWKFHSAAWQINNETRWPVNVVKTITKRPKLSSTNRSTSSRVFTINTWLWWVKKLACEWVWHVNDYLFQRLNRAPFTIAMT